MVCYKQGRKTNWSHVKRHLLVWWWIYFSPSAQLGSACGNQLQKLSIQQHEGWEFKQMALDIGCGMMAKNLELYVCSIYFYLICSHHRLPSKQRLKRDKKAKSVKNGASLEAPKIFLPGATNPASIVFWGPGACFIKLYKCVLWPKIGGLPILGCDTIFFSF